MGRPVRLLCRMAILDVEVESFLNSARAYIKPENLTRYEPKYIELMKASSQGTVKYLMLQANLDLFHPSLG